MDAAGSPVRKACIQPSHEMIIIELLVKTGVELVKYAGTGSKKLSKKISMLPGTRYAGCAQCKVSTEPRVLRPPCLSDCCKSAQTQELFWRVLLLRLPIVDPVCCRLSAMQCPAPL